MESESKVTNDGSAPAEKELAGEYTQHEEINPKWALMELSGALAMVMLFLWGIRPLDNHVAEGGAIAVFLGLVYWSKRRTGDTLRDQGLRFDNFFSSLVVVLPCTLLGMVVLFVGWSQFFPVNTGHIWNNHRFYRTLYTYPIWALAQQYVALAFVFRRWEEVFAKRPIIAVFCSALCFSLIHWPNPALMVLCFIAGFFWTLMFTKWDNLFVIAISHGLFGTLCKHVLYVYMKVGPKAEPWVWSKLL